MMTLWTITGAKCYVAEAGLVNEGLEAGDTGGTVGVTLLFHSLPLRF